jgi:hypothetical protein
MVHRYTALARTKYDNSLTGKEKGRLCIYLGLCNVQYLESKVQTDGYE